MSKKDNGNGGLPMYSLVLGVVVGGLVLYHFRDKFNLKPESQGGTNADEQKEVAQVHNNLAYYANTRRLHWL